MTLGAGQETLNAADLKKAVTKAAKKALKKEGDLKLVDLTSRIATKLQTADVEAVKAALERSSKLVIHDHVVSLKQKRKRSSGNKEEEEATTAEDTNNKSSRKKALNIVMK